LGVFGPLSYLTSISSRIQVSQSTEMSVEAKRSGWFLISE
jgi:hypothetical protein